MFLNRYGQPFIFDKNNESAQVEEGFNSYQGPMLVCGSPHGSLTMPNDWQGTIVGTPEIIDKYLAVFPHLKNDSIILRPTPLFKPTVISVGDELIDMVIVPAGKDQKNEDVTVFILKDDYTNKLVTNELGYQLDWLPKAGTAFHETLNDGFDVMYIDDSLYTTKDMAQLEIEFKHQDIYALVELIQPRALVGLRRMPLPKCLLDLCCSSN